MKGNRFYSSSRKSQQGLALVMVLFVISICIILATEISGLQSYQIHRAKNVFQRQQAFWYAMGSEHFAKTLLQQVAKNDKGVFNLEQPWAIEGMSFPVDNGLIEGRIVDMYSCFNLNGLYKPDATDEEIEYRKSAFVRYLESLDIESEVSAEDLTDNLYDWLDEDDYPTSAVGYDGDMYGTLDFPYLTGNSPLAHENELRVIYGFTPSVMAQLEQRFCVIPNNHELTLNVNTVKQEKPELLMALFNISRSEAQNIIAERPNDGYRDMGDFWESPKVATNKEMNKIEKSHFTVKSKFFKLITHAHYNDMKFALTSVIQLKDNRTSVIARRFGGEIEREADPEDEQSTN